MTNLDALTLALTLAPDGEPARCLHCGAVFADAEAAYEARREARA